MTARSTLEANLLDPVRASAHQALSGAADTAYDFLNPSRIDIPLEVMSLGMAPPVSGGIKGVIRGKKATRAPRRARRNRLREGWEVEPRPRGEQWPTNTPYVTESSERRQRRVAQAFLRKEAGPEHTRHESLMQEIKDAVEAGKGQDPRLNQLWNEVYEIERGAWDRVREQRLEGRDAAREAADTGEPTDADLRNLEAAQADPLDDIMAAADEAAVADPPRGLIPDESLLGLWRDTRRWMALESPDEYRHVRELEEQLNAEMLTGEERQIAIDIINTTDNAAYEMRRRQIAARNLTEPYRQKELRQEGILKAHTEDSADAPDALQRMGESEFQLTPREQRLWDLFRNTDDLDTKQEILEQIAQETNKIISSQRRVMEGAPRAPQVSSGRDTHGRGPDLQVVSQEHAQELAAGQEVLAGRWSGQDRNRVMMGDVTLGDADVRPAERAAGSRALVEDAEELQRLYGVDVRHGPLGRQGRGLNETVLDRADAENPGGVPHDIQDPDRGIRRALYGAGSNLTDHPFLKGGGPFTLPEGNVEDAVGLQFAEDAYYFGPSTPFGQRAAQGLAELGNERRKIRQLLSQGMHPRDIAAQLATTPSDSQAEILSRVLRIRAEQRQGLSAKDARPRIENRGWREHYQGLTNEANRADATAMQANMDAQRLEIARSRHADAQGEIAKSQRARERLEAGDREVADTQAWLETLTPDQRAAWRAERAEDATRAPAKPAEVMQADRPGPFQVDYVGTPAQQQAIQRLVTELNLPEGAQVTRLQERMGRATPGNNPQVAKQQLNDLYGSIWQKLRTHFADNTERIPAPDVPRTEAPVGNQQAFMDPNRGWSWDDIRQHQDRVQDAWARYSREIADDAPSSDAAAPRGLDPDRPTVHQNRAMYEQARSSSPEEWARGGRTFKHPRPGGTPTGMDLSTNDLDAMWYALTQRIPDDEITNALDIDPRVLRAYKDAWEQPLAYIWNLGIADGPRVSPTGRVITDDYVPDTDRRASSDNYERNLETVVSDQDIARFRESTNQLNQGTYPAQEANAERLRQHRATVEENVAGVTPRQEAAPPPAPPPPPPPPRPRQQTAPAAPSAARETVAENVAATGGGSRPRPVQQSEQKPSGDPAAAIRNEPAPVTERVIGGHKYRVGDHVELPPGFAVPVDTIVEISGAENMGMVMLERSGLVDPSDIKPYF